MDATFRPLFWESRADKCLENIDPIDSLAFDVSVARHAIEEAEYERAKTWLDGNHALLEFRRSVEQKFLDKEEAEDIGWKLNHLTQLLDEDPLDALREIVELQNILSKKAYLAFCQCVSLGVKL